MVDAWNPKEGQRQVFELQCEKTGKVFEIVNNMFIAVKRSKVLMVKHQTKIRIQPTWETR